MKKNNIYNTLFEAESSVEKKAPEDPVSVKEPGVKARPADDSVDDQIDSLILRYENSSIRADEKNKKSKPVTLGESLKNLNLKYLFEQEDEFGEEEEDDDPVEDETYDDPDPEGSEDMTVSKPADDQEVPPLDVDEFTSRVVRLIMNHKNLLNIEEAIINRVKNFLDENYGDPYVNEYLDNLEEKHGIVVNQFGSLEYNEDEKFAIGANPEGAGSMGGGGA